MTPRKTRPSPTTHASKYIPWIDVPETRRRTMSAIRSRDTQPELTIRRLLHAKGYRFLVSKRLGGFRPDLLFARRRKVIFVHGCFWHGHHTCGHDRVPKTRSDYWRQKIEGNRVRDARAQTTLEGLGWEVMVLWECEILRATNILPHVVEFLGPPRWPTEVSAGVRLSHIMQAA